MLASLRRRWPTPFLLLVGVCMLLGCRLQDHYLYYPSSRLPTSAELKAEGLQPWAAAAGDYRGLVAATDAPSPRGTVVVFHGNGGTALDRGYYLQGLGALGFRVILAEYPRYGGRPGRLGEEAFVTDARETVRRAARDGGPLYLLGESLGCAVVAGVVRAAEVPVAGVILITPWETLNAVARRHFPYLPLRLLLDDRYDNVANLAGYRGRVAVVGAARDEIIPLVHARDLFAALPTAEKRFWAIAGAGHNDWPYFTDASWWREVTAFVAN